MYNKEIIEYIRWLNKSGFSIKEIPCYLRSIGVVSPALNTVRKFCKMEYIPDDPGHNLKKQKAFDQEPFRSTILNVLESAKDPKMCLSSLYDLLIETYVDSGQYKQLPGNDQTLRRYVAYLRENNILSSKSVPNKRQYTYAREINPAERMQLDFGSYSIGNHTFYYFCCLLLYSRYLHVVAQDHPYSSLEACQAIYSCFVKMNGRPLVLIIDQDKTFVLSEKYGESVLTGDFEKFCQEQDLTCYICHKHDPESKGAVENLVGFVEKNFLSARSHHTVNELISSLPGWVERQNRRLHRSTRQIPSTVFSDIEQKALRSLIPSFFSTLPSSFTRRKADKCGYLRYLDNNYSLPAAYANCDIMYKVVDQSLYVFDTKKQHICTHDIDAGKGKNILLPAHERNRNETSYSAVKLFTRWSIPSLHGYIDSVYEKNPRYAYNQLFATKGYFETRHYIDAEIEKVMQYCCKHNLFSFSQIVEIAREMINK